MRIRCPPTLSFSFSRAVAPSLSRTRSHDDTKPVLQRRGCPGFFRSYFIYSYYYYYYFFSACERIFIYRWWDLPPHTVEGLPARARPCSSVCKRDRGQVYLHVSVCVLRLSFDCVRFAGAIRRHSLTLTHTHVTYIPTHTHVNTHERMHAHTRVSTPHTRV